ncbi:MAG TPA: photosynthetic reaction center cytochrome c subunit family protein [Puia sp.]|nr:photosynthetic reaction center cytochrome c subunit family protein [Puia sp.]
MLKLVIAGCLLLSAAASSSFGLFRNQISREGVKDFQDSLAADRQKHIDEVNQMIKGRENDKAEDVYKNLKYIGGFNAGLLPKIMNKWSVALGVSCGHCHEIGSWDRDSKPEKEIARKMAAMSPVILNYLRTIKELKNQNPIVNCTTCHRGQVKPAIDMAN